MRHKPETIVQAACAAARGRRRFDNAEQQIDSAATEQLFGHVKDEFNRGRAWASFEDFKRDLEEYIVHWNTRRRQVRLKGLAPEGVGNQALAA